MTIYHWIGFCIVAFVVLACIAVYGLSLAEEQEYELALELRETTPQPWWASYDRFERWVVGPAACAVIGAVLMLLGPTLDRSDAARVADAEAQQ